MHIECVVYFKTLYPAPLPHQLGHEVNKALDLPLFIMYPGALSILFKQ